MCIFTSRGLRSRTFELSIGTKEQSISDTWKETIFQLCETSKSQKAFILKGGGAARSPYLISGTHLPQ